MTPLCAAAPAGGGSLCSETRDRGNPRRHGLNGARTKGVVSAAGIRLFGASFATKCPAKYGKSPASSPSPNGIVGAGHRHGAYGCGLSRRAVRDSLQATTRSFRSARLSSAQRRFTPIVVRMSDRRRIFGAQTHSQSPEALFTSLRLSWGASTLGRKAVIAASRPDPVIFLERSGSTTVSFDGPTTVR